MLSAPSPSISSRAMPTVICRVTLSPSMTGILKSGSFTKAGPETAGAPFSGLPSPAARAGTCAEVKPTQAIAVSSHLEVRLEMAIPRVGHGDRRSVLVIDLDAFAALDAADRGDRYEGFTRDGGDAIGGIGGGGGQQLIVIAPPERRPDAGPVGAGRRPGRGRKRQVGRLHHRPHAGGLADVAEIGDQSVGYVHHRPRDADEALSKPKSRLWQAIAIDEKIAMSRAELGQLAMQDAQAERSVSERAGDEHAIAGLRAPAQDRLAGSHAAHGSDREGHRARCRDGIAAE